MKKILPTTTVNIGCCSHQAIKPSHYSPPDSEPWANSGLKQDACHQAVSHCLAISNEVPWRDSGQDTGCWPYRAQVHIKGITSMSPDFCIFPDTEEKTWWLRLGAGGSVRTPPAKKTWVTATKKSSKFINLICLVFLTVIFWCSDYLVFVAKTPVYPGSSLTSLEQTESYLRGFALVLSPQFYLPNKT